ncbi:MAG: site-2 protease family protein [bacterium]|nr:site-2 protease family protein [bacterium]
MEGILLPVFYIVVILYSVTIHEVSHGLMANSLGDSTAKNLGRLSLNPLKHLDPFGSVLLPFFLYITTGFAFGYAKPVPYNPNNLNDKKYGPVKVAIAGPLSNLVLALLFGFSLRFMPDVFSTSLVPELFSRIVIMNLVLAVFNMFPVPPLDGHWLLMTFLPSRFNALKVYMYKNSFFIFPIFLIIFMFYVSPLIYWLFRLITGVGL